MGLALDGSALDSSALDGSALDGSALDGSALDGSALDGSALDGSALDADKERGDKALPHRLESGEEDEAGDMGDDERDGIGSLSPPPVVVQPWGPPAVAPQVAERPHVYVGASLR